MEASLTKSVCCMKVKETKKRINSMNDSVFDNIFGLVLSVDQFVVADVREVVYQRQNRLMIYRDVGSK